MTAYQQGDVAAFAELVARHEKPLWNFLRRFVKDPATAEDLLQETFMRVIKNASSYQASAKFSTWLYTIGRNLCVDHARSALHRRAVSLDKGAPSASEGEHGVALHERLSGGEPSGETRTLNRELAGALDRAIAALPEPQREVFLMRELLDLPFAEIAEAVGASEPTVKSRMRYALERLRGELSALHDGALREVRP
jgi:RNA polymerase sigma-70 factor, ECF subfamily